MTKYLVIGFQFFIDEETEGSEIAEMLGVLNGNYRFISLAQLRRDVEARASETSATIGGFEQEKYTHKGVDCWCFRFVQYVSYEVPENIRLAAWELLDGESYPPLAFGKPIGTPSAIYRKKQIGTLLGRYQYDEEGSIYLAEGV